MLFVVGVCLESSAMKLKTPLQNKELYNFQIEQNPKDNKTSQLEETRLVKKQTQAADMGHSQNRRRL